MKKLTHLIVGTIFSIWASASSAALIQLEATLDGSQEVPSVETDGSGSATMTFDDISMLFSWDINWSDLTEEASAAHFHGPAAAGENAGVQIALDISDMSAMGSQVLTAEQSADLLNNLWYINVHTSTFPSGEIRGQVLVASGQVPTAATFALFSLGFAVLVGFRRKSV